MSFDDHPLRYALTNELHARPFPSLTAPGQAIYLAIKEPSQAAKRDRGRDRAHLLALLDRFGAQHPKPDATHFFGDLGKFRLKWEQHTEFVTYTAFVDNGLSRPFDPAAWEVFPEDWLADIPGARITSAHLVYLPAPEDEAEIEPLIHDWFVPESLAVSRVLDDTAAIAGDFRIDSSGHLRFAIFTRPDTGQRRLGRVVQRICEIGDLQDHVDAGPASGARNLRQAGPDRRAPVASGDRHDGRSVQARTRRWASFWPSPSELEKLQTESAFRFGATGAYDAIVTQRVQVSAEGAVSRAPDLRGIHDAPLRPGHADGQVDRGAAGGHDGRGRSGQATCCGTRVDVDRSAPEPRRFWNPWIGGSDMALRLQKTVEGLSVVAISYYAVNLVVLPDRAAGGAPGHIGDPADPRLRSCRRC